MFKKLLMSFPRKRESRNAADQNFFWIPASAGMTLEESKNNNSSSEHNSSALLAVTNLTLGFAHNDHPIKILDNINFQINHEETLALVGESGSGKSLIALSILQLLPPSAIVDSASSIYLNNQNLFQLSEVAMRKIRGKKIGMIFQEASLAFNPVLTIGYQIRESLRLHLNLSAHEQQQRTLHWLHEVGIPNPKRCAASYPHELSGGMRQRAMIAMALAPDPDLIIADEPTTALDVSLQMSILDLLKELQHRGKHGMLFITHDLGLVYRIADKVAVISKGKILEQQDARNFFEKPKSSYTHTLLNAQPGFEKRDLNHNSVASNNVLEVKDLKIYFPIRKGLLQRKVGYIKAVENVSFAVQQGKTLALIGESGSGKTSIAKGILHLVPVFDGEIDVFGQNWVRIPKQQLKQMRGELQMVFQDPYSSMNPRMHIGQIIAEGMLTQGLYKNYAACVPEIEAMLQRVGLSTESIHRYPHEFSGGQRQRICIARALAMRPKIIICDEPTSALDVVVQMEILNLLRSLQREFNISYLLITHNIAVVAYMADEVVVLKDGKIVESGAVTQILLQPQQEYTKHLLASVAKLPEATTIS